MSEQAQRKIDSEYGRLISILNRAFAGYRISADTAEDEDLLHEAYLLLEFSSNYHKPWMKRRNQLLRRIRKLYPEWKDEKITFEQETSHDR